MAKLTSEEITAIYNELSTLRVPLDADATKGLEYVKERLMMTRAAQDRCNELMLKVNRALSDVWQEKLVASQQQTLQPTSEGKARVANLDGERQEHVLLASMVKMQGQLLSRTAQDIRLLADLTKEQIKLGEIDPHVAGKEEKVSVTDIVDFAQDAVEAAQKPAPEPSAKTVDLSDQSGIIGEVREQPLPQTDAVDFESLFGDLNVQTPAGRPF